MIAASTTVDGAVEDITSNRTPSTAKADPSPSALMETVPFSSGNPKIEETRGIMHLFLHDPRNLPVDRKPHVCVLEVPNYLTYANFCQLCGSFVQHVQEMRIVRKDGVDDKYSVLMKFDGLISTDDFYRHFNGKKFLSLEVDVWQVLYVVDVQYTSSVEHAQSSVASATELPSCPLCLDRLEQDTGGIIRTICNHSFHCSCISKWEDSSCPVCRYCQQQPEKSTCSVCGTFENLWMCIICGFVGCGRYKEGHAIGHWKDTEHCYSQELETQRVWDYVGDNYVHRLIQSKTDGKLVELNHNCAHSKDIFGSCECAGDSGVGEALIHSKVDAIVEEYNVLLESQLESQKSYFESLLQEVKEKVEKEISEAIQKAVSSKHQKLQLKLDKCARERNFLADLNETLLKNEEIWKMKIKEAEEREQKTVNLRNEKIKALEEQLQDLMMHIETGKLIDGMPTDQSKDIKDSIILSIPSVESSSKVVSSSVSNKHTQKGHKRRT